MSQAVGSPIIGFAHAAYRLRDEYLRRGAGFDSFEVRTLSELEARIGEVDVLVVSGLWRNALAERAPKLRLIQSISAGTDQFARDVLRNKGIQLASAQGANERAVAEHAMALMLALTRQLHMARDFQRQHHWRPMIGDHSRREDELDGKTLLIVGLGRIGKRLARLAAAFGMTVIGVKREPAPVPDVSSVVSPAQLSEVLPLAHFVALTCSLNPETQGLMGAAAFAAMRADAYLINVARGLVVDEPALIDALRGGVIAGAGLDCACEEPLPGSSAIWDLPNVLVTPHSAGETRHYERRVIDLLLENIERAANNLPLTNQIV
ncbi:D-2-hydroxyacid dehydrogenase [Ancylobacter sp. Lp-2]|uniref:D-2-hydroxyacid dehydrogenase n=1 Tax=Ancylobacter sp. Lp-2 TaxID=2881339 RepID=UPI001E3BE01F|nr:D-2-hydroxyacid dehydrogenase [Ancylobacter sp. Lp-2]MCB4771579.1 D-2-hydroxyacid dehydrogenase [Ancylobacter sp. Lp-2]